MSGDTRLVDLVNAARGRCAGCMLLPTEAEKLKPRWQWRVCVCACAHMCMHLDSRTHIPWISSDILIRGHVHKADGAGAVVVGGKRTSLFDWKCCLLLEWR